MVAQEQEQVTTYWCGCAVLLIGSKTIKMCTSALKSKAYTVFMLHKGAAESDLDELLERKRQGPY